MRYLRARYAARKPDVVIAVGSSALELELARRDELFAGVPIVFANVDHREVEGREMPPNVTGLWMAWDYQRTVELALVTSLANRSTVRVPARVMKELEPRVFVVDEDQSVRTRVGLFHLIDIDHLYISRVKYPRPLATVLLTKKDLQT